jgi:hypothetical protein
MKNFLEEFAGKLPRNFATRNFPIGLALATLLITGLSVRSAEVVTGDETFRHVTELTSQIHWYTGLAQAEYQAQREGKLVLWLHMLGDLSGAT